MTSSDPSTENTNLISTMDVANCSDAEIMQRVLDLAALGMTSTQPNPKVGCILVNDGKVVGQGWPSVEVRAVAQSCCR